MKALKFLLLPYLAAVIVGAFLWPAPAQGFIGESSRIVFFHVPCAWTSALAFLVAAAYSLFAAVLMPFLFFVAPRVTSSLHPQTVINPQGKILMDAPTKAVFFGALIGFSWLFVWMLGIEARAARLARRERARGET